MVPWAWSRISIVNSVDIVEGLVGVVLICVAVKLAYQFILLEPLNVGRQGYAHLELNLQIIVLRTNARSNTEVYLTFARCVFVLVSRGRKISL